MLLGGDSRELPSEPGDVLAGPCEHRFERVRLRHRRVGRGHREAGGECGGQNERETHDGPPERRSRASLNWTEDPPPRTAQGQVRIRSMKHIRWIVLSGLVAALVAVMAAADRSSATMATAATKFLAG